MKLIIDIDEEYYNYAKQQVADGITNPFKIYISNGTPIPDNATVCDIEQIRDEIEQMIAESERAIRPFDGMETVIYTNGFKDGIGSAIDVIDKYK